MRQAVRSSRTVRVLMIDVRPWLPPTTRCSSLAVRNESPSLQTTKIIVFADPSTRNPYTLITASEDAQRRVISGKEVLQAFFEAFQAFFKAFSRAFPGLEGWVVRRSQVFVVNLVSALLRGETVRT